MSESLIDRLLSGLSPSRYLKKRGPEVERFAARHGLLYLQLGAPRMPALGHQGGQSSTGRMDNMLKGQWRGLPVTGFEGMIAVNKGLMPHTPHMPQATHPAAVYATPQVKSAYCSTVQADLPAALPDLMIRSKVTLTVLRSNSPLPGHNIRIGSAEFNRLFEVATADTTFAAKLMDVRMIEWLVSTGGEFTFKIQSPNLLNVWCPLLPTTALARVFDAAKDFTDHIPQQIWTEYGTG